ncbi:MAG: hypothetical protein U1E62_08830 [Alsobacter sp.]
MFKNLLDDQGIRTLVRVFCSMEFFMTSAISSSYLSGLVNLADINSGIETSQGRLASGLAVAKASDNPATYFRAKSYSDKADDYANVNKNITAAMGNMDVVDKALGNMQDALKASLSLMTDARAKAIPQSLTAQTNGDTVYGSRAAVAAGQNTAAVLALKGMIVSTKSVPVASAAAAPADINDGSVFQQGDVFAITITDTANPGAGGTQTRYFRATSTEAAVSDSAQVLNAQGQFVNATAAGAVAAAGVAAVAATGATAALAFNFNDMASLQTAIQKAFGTSQITVNMNEIGGAGTGNFTMGFALANNTSSISFQQTNDQGQSAGAANNANNPVDAGVAFNFSALFGNQQGYVYNAPGVQQFAANGNAQLAYNTTATQGKKTVGGVTGNSFTYSSIGATKAQLDDVLLARKSAADYVRQTLTNLKNLTGDASMPGFNNILKGETMTVQLNDTNTSSQNVKLAYATDALSLGFVGYAEANGVGNTAATQNDFNTDADINTTIAQVNGALARLKQNQSFLAAARTQISSRLDYNKSMAVALQAGATSLTAADTNEEATSLASLQTRQSFAVNNLAATKQAEQSLIQLLR